jgi:hypothetical protein
MEKMMKDMAIKPSGDIDRDFVAINGRDPLGIADDIAGPARCAAIDWIGYRLSQTETHHPRASRHRLLGCDSHTGARHALVVNTLGVIVGRERLIQTRHAAHLRLAGLDGGEKPRRSRDAR